MNLIRYPWKKTALNRLILSFICILLPIYVLSMIIYNWGIRTLQEEISKSMASQVSQYASDLEKEFSRIQALQYDCLTDDNLNALAAIPGSMNDIEKVQRILNLQTRLNAIKNSSVYIQEVHAYIPSVQKDISATTVSALDKAEFDRFLSVPISSDAQVFKVNGSLNMVAAYPYLLPSSKREPIVILAIELSAGKLRNALDGMRNSPEEGLIFDTTPITISTNADSAFNEAISARIHNEPAASNARSVKLDGHRYLTVHTASPFFDGTLIKYVPEKAVFQPLQKFRSWFVLLAAVSLAIILFYSLYVYKYIHKPLDRLVKAFRKVEFGDVEVQIAHSNQDEFQYIYRRFNAMLGNLKSLIDQVYKQQILMQKAELKQLQSQINPHFLYNSFFILNTMARLGDYEQLEKFTNQLGEYFQFVTRSSADEVPMAKEVSHAKVYAEIQGMRFYNRVDVDFEELPAGWGHVMVPRLILQPLIENAFEHGLERKAANGLLGIRFEKKDDLFLIRVEDNGDEIDDGTIETLNRLLDSEEPTETTGLLNIHQRIRLKFGPLSGLRFERNERGGLTVTVTIHWDERG